MTQSGGQAAGIQLQVGLDLAYFRGQMQKVSNIASSEFTSRLDVRFNKRTLDAELNNLQRAIKRRVYRVEIGGNLSSLPGQIKDLREQLSSLEDTKIDVGVGAVKSLSKKDAQKIKTDLRQSILSEDKKILVPVSIKSSITREDVRNFKNAVKSKLSGLSIDVKANVKGGGFAGSPQGAAGLMEFMQSQGMIGKTASGMKMQMGGGNLEDSLNNLQQQAKKLATDLVAMGNAARTTGQASIQEAGKVLRPQNYGLKINSLVNNVEKLGDGLRRADQETASSLLPQLTGLSSTLRTVTSSFVSVFGANRGLDDTLLRFDAATRQAANAVASYAERIQRRAGGPATSTAGPPLLPGSQGGALAVRSAGLNPYKIITAQVRESFNIIEDYHKRQLNSFIDDYKKIIDQYHRNVLINTARQQVRNVRVSELAQGPSQAMLPGARVAGLLAGRPSQASVLELNNILAGAIREYFNAVAREIKPSATTQGRPLLGPGSTVAGLLPPAGGTTAGVNRMRTSTGSFTGRGYEPPGGFPTDGQLGGRQGPATFIGAGSQMEKFKTGLDIAAASTRNFTASQIPLVGGIKNLAGEFGQAAKQVLLYGTAYKGLAFITSLPGQVLNAAKSQQQYNNALQTVTQDTGTYGKELLYVDNVQRAFGLNLETTRTGFTRLYASMAPTGFDSGSIEKLFTGISAATAALQLTPDKAERVIYAFGQMASKGQIMSEELKGQLGDVLPGALAIFSKAAGMSVKDFSKAMEDGEFVGNRFREVFAKVSDELMNRFGTGAQVAGRSLQGLINTVGGDFQRTLESFAPLANAAAQATLGPLTGMLREVSMAAQIAMGEQDRVGKQLKAAQADVSTLKLGGADAKEIKAAEQNVAALASKYEVLNEAAKDPAISQQVKNIEAFVVEIQKAATFTMNLAGIIGSVLNPLFTALGGNLTSVIGNLALLALGFNAAKLAALLMMGVVNTMNAIQGITAAGAAGTTALAGAFRLLGIQATGAQVATIGFGVAIKGLLISTGIGAVVVLLGSLAAAFLSVGNKAKEAADRAKRSIDSMADAARTGNVSLIEMELSVNKADRQDVENLIKSVEELKGRKGAKGVELITLTPELKREAKRLGAEVAGEVSRGSVLGSLKALRKPLQEAAAEGVKDLAAARKRAEVLGMNKPDPSAAAAGEEASGAGKPPKEKSLESYYSLQDQLAKSFTQHQIDLLDIEHQHKVSLMNVFYDLQESRANSHQKAAIRFQKELYNIAAEYQGAQLKAQAEVMKAQGSVAGGALPGGTATGAYLQGNIGPTSTGPHFDVKKMGGGYFPRNYLDQYVQVNGRPLSSGTTVPGGTFAGHQRRGSHGWDYAFGEGRHAATLKGGAQWMGGSPTAHGEARKFQLPTGEQFQFLHGKSEGIGAPGKITADQSRSVRASQQTQLAIQKEKVAVTLKEVEAIRKMEVAMENYVASIVPIAEQDLQNRLLAQRIQLTTDIASPVILDAQIKYAEQEAMAAENIRLNNEEITKLSQVKDANGRISVETAARIETLRQANEKLKTSLPTSQIQLLTDAIGNQTLSILEQVKVKQREAEDSRQVNRLIIEGMTRQEAEAKLAADRFRGDYAKALDIANEAVRKISAEQEIYNIKKAQNIALTKGETDEYNRLASALEEAKKRRDELQGKAPEVEGAATALETSATPMAPSEAIEGRIATLKEEITALTDIGNVAITVADGIGDAFGTAFKGLIDGSMTAKEALGSFFKSVADMFLDMAAQIIAKQITMIILQTILKALGAFGGGGGGSDYSGAFKSTPGTSFGDALKMPKLAANGATFANGIAKFANGGAFSNAIVTAPTMFKFADGGAMKAGLMGEAGPEAIMPLSRGAGGRLGVDASGLREAMDRQSGGGNGSPVLNMSFQSTSINGVEYVSRDQLEQAMAETRRASTRDGAKRGMTMTLDRIQNSSSTRRKVGI